MTEDVTDLLLEWNENNREALDRLMPVVQHELRKLAAIHLSKEQGDHTLQPTELVNELYLRLIDRRRVSWEKRAHFFGFAATTMRRILVEHARAKKRLKRGSGTLLLPLDEAAEVSSSDSGSTVDIVALDEALGNLAKLDPQQSRLVELRYFAGLTVHETAAVLGISPASVSRSWITAKAWLHTRLHGSRAPLPPSAEGAATP